MCLITHNNAWNDNILRLVYTDWNDNILWIINHNINHYAYLDNDYNKYKKFKWKKAQMSLKTYIKNININNDYNKYITILNVPYDIIFSDIL